MSFSNIFKNMFLENADFELIEDGLNTIKFFNHKLKREIIIEKKDLGFFEEEYRVADELINLFLDIEQIANMLGILTNMKRFKEIIFELNKHNKYKEFYELFEDHIQMTYGKEEIKKLENALNIISTWTKDLKIIF